MSVNIHKPRESAVMSMRDGYVADKQFASAYAYGCHMQMVRNYRTSDLAKKSEYSQCQNTLNKYECCTLYIRLL